MRHRIRAGLRSGGRWLLDTLLPPECPGCGSELPARRWLCTPCRRRFRAVPPEALCLPCRLASRSARGREAGLGCTRGEHAEGRGRAAWWMEPPLDAVIHRFKYGGVPSLANPLARTLAGRFRPSEVEGILAVPLHAARRRERGYDQAELLARALAIRWGIPYVPGLLERGRATRAQARLPEGARAANVAGAFRVVQPPWVRGRIWALVDDVVTTGSTLEAAAGRLREAGAGGVVPVVLALA